MDKRDSLSVKTDLVNTSDGAISPTKVLIRACKDKDGWVVVGGDKSCPENGETPVNGTETNEAKSNEISNTQVQSHPLPKTESPSKSSSTRCNVPRDTSAR